jgi:CubicO group peptidase (beta-lactamase class C family)
LHSNLVSQKKDWDRPLAFQPGTDWGYGEGLDWAGKVVEKASGRSLGEYLEEHVWIPLKMTGTTFHPEQRGEYQLLEMGQRKDGRGSRLVANPGQHYPVPALNEAGGAGLFSNAEDYSKLLAALLRDDGVLLKKEIIEELMKPQLNDAGKGALKREREKWVLQEIPREVPVDYALGGLVTTGDVPGGRPKGAVAWDGFSNSNWVRVFG